MGKKLHRIFCLILILLLMSGQLAAQEFIIEDIRVQGLQRITPGTVFNYLPMKVGDIFDDSASAEAIRALYKTGLFNDIRLERDGDILVLLIEERPTIGNITLSGNESVKSDDLLDGLRQIGFAEGRVFDRSQLDKLQQELKRQYFSLGKYDIKIDSAVDPLENNRVAVSINVSEGVSAKIRQIRIIGNQSFSQKKLLKNFQLTPPSFLSFFTKSDQYSREKLSADLETLRSFYLDRGYANFNLESTQVSITPDKKDIYITINLIEGKLFAISEVQLAGDTILPLQTLFASIEIEKGELFSVAKMIKSSDAIKNQLSEEGYAFANVNPVPDIDTANKTAKITFFIDSGQRTYVRRINFIGNTKTLDEVLRREMRLHEGSWVSTSKVERGRIRLQRLGFFEDVNVETIAVPGSTDQVDINYTVTERASGNLGAGIGFSQTAGLVFNTSINQNNFLGSGKRISLDFNNSEINRRFGLGYTNPYYTIDGISRSLNGFYRQTDSLEANITAFDSTIQGGSVSFGIPVTEFNTFRTTLAYENTTIDTTSSVADTVRAFVFENGNKYDVLRWINGFSYDSRNRAILPDAGILHRIEAEVALPSFNNSLQFYKISYRTQWFVSLYADYILSLKGGASFGQSYANSSSKELPFFENFYAGGPRSVRGYEENTLGPLDNFSRPLGGNFRLLGGAEVILPVPFFKDIKSVRFTGFFDAGNVYNTESQQGVDLGLLRYSVGFGAIWVSPFGVISVSIAEPFGEQLGDSLQRFQFNFGASF